MQKILTNIKFYHVAGMSQYLCNFVEHNEKKGSFKVHAVNICSPQEKPSREFNSKKYRHFKSANYIVDSPALDTVNEMSKSDLDVYRAAYKEVIKSYDKEIRKVKPNIILINGSYIMPWCLLQAARSYKKAKIVVHYHGILTKEVAHWKNKKHKANMRLMEKDFDSKDILYIFPSELAKKTVEKEVFGHKIKSAFVLPNPVPDVFFKNTRRRTNKHAKVGVVGRWSRVKNMDFVIRLAKLNQSKKDPLKINMITNRDSYKNTKGMYGNMISFKPPVPMDKLKSFYTDQDIMMSPSFFETYGNVPQEAVASGTPALISKNMGVAETFRKVGLEEYIVDFDSPAEMLKKLKKAIGKPVPPKSIKRLEEYNSTNVFNKYFDLLLSIANHKNSRFLGLALLALSSYS